MIWWLLMLAGTAQGQTPHACSPCHTEQIADFGSHKHASKAGLECGVCHGPSDKHRKSNGEASPDRVAAPDEVAAMCGNCHAQEKSQYMQSKHQVAMVRRTVKSANCSTCHGHHAMKEWTVTQAGCAKCHATTPAACKGKPAGSAVAKVSCMNCHARHTLAVTGP